MTIRPALALGWLLAAPGFVILLALLVVVTPLFDLLGCRTAGILSIRCGSDAVFAIMDPLWIVVLIATSFPPVSGAALLYAVGFTGWRAYRAWRTRQGRL